MTYQVQHSIPYFTNIPSDVVSNVFHFEWEGTGSPDGPALTELTDSVANFFEGIYGTSGRMAPWMLPGSAHQKVYDLEQPTPRVPIFDAAVPLTVGTQTTLATLPTEVSVCCSITADPVSGVPLASTRGRVFIGGLGITAVTGGSTTAFPVPLAGLRTGIAVAAEALRDAVSVTEFRWVIYSRKLLQSFPVTHGFIDDAFDTQRRRGQAASTRTLWA